MGDLIPKEHRDEFEMNGGDLFRNLASIVNAYTFKSSRSSAAAALFLRRGVDVRVKLKRIHAGFAHQHEQRSGHDYDGRNRGGETSE